MFKVTINLLVGSRVENYITPTRNTVKRNGLLSQASLRFLFEKQINENVATFCRKWGRGISLILSKEPNTEFKEVGTHFITVFKRKKNKNR